MTEETLASVRRRIGEIDGEIMRLVCSRIKEAEKIGKIKRDGKVPVRDFTVEAQVIERAEAVCEMNGIDRHIGREVAKSLVMASVSAQTSSDTPVYEGRARKILIVGGSGKMGGWYANFFNVQGHEVIVNDITPSSKYRFDGDILHAAEAADIILLSTPISATAGILSMLIDAGAGATIMDGCSLKSPLMGEIRRGIGKGLRITSIHPMFGPGTKMLADQNLIICDCGSRDAVEDASSLFRDTSLNMTVLELERHDELMAYVLGATHALNIAFFSMLAESTLSMAELKRFASTTFTNQLSTAADVAHENPMLYYEIQNLNVHRNTVFSSLIGSVEKVRDCSFREKPDDFIALMRKGMEYTGVAGRE